MIKVEYYIIIYIIEYSNIVIKVESITLLSHPSILGVTLCFCTGSYAAAAVAGAAAAAGRRFLSTR